MTNNVVFDFRKSLISTPIEFFTDNLRDRNPFTFARYGDGEWLAILGFHGSKNSNGCTYTPQLSRALQQVIRDKNPYRHGMLRIAVSDSRGRKSLVPRIKAKLTELDAEDLVWYKGDVLLEKSLKGLLFPLVQELQKKRILFVGPEHCRRINERFFNYVDYIQPPPQNAILERGSIVPAVLKSVKKNQVDVIGWSSGLHSKVFINDIYKEMGDTITQIDFGSMWDGYFQTRQKGSRTYIRRGLIRFQDLLDVNSGSRAKQPGENFRKDNL